MPVVLFIPFVYHSTGSGSTANPVVTVSNPVKTVSDTWVVFLKTATVGRLWAEARWRSGKSPIDQHAEFHRCISNHQLPWTKEILQQQDALFKLLNNQACVLLAYMYGLCTPKLQSKKVLLVNVFKKRGIPPFKTLEIQQEFRRW